ncbi:MAG: DUF2177 family protein [Proteobacteria bacterium]|nr:DUF2177 family protein [Pseudomonadota bacterium]
MRPVIAYIVTALVFGGLDAVWLTSTGATLYKPVLGDLILDKPRLIPAAVFYVLYILGLVWFAILPALNAGQWSKALLNGLLFGLIAYATYDLTNQATLKVWSTRITLMDLGWGAFASAAACTVAYFVTSALSRR